MPDRLFISTAPVLNRFEIFKHLMPDEEKQPENVSEPQFHDLIFKYIRYRQWL